MDYKLTLQEHNFTIEQIKKFYGIDDSNIKLIEKNFKCSIKANSENLIISTTEDNLDEIKKCISIMIEIILNGEEIDNVKMNEIIFSIINKSEIINENVKFYTTFNNKIIRPKNKSQLRYYHMLEDNTIIFAMGAAGTGKTYLAVAYGMNMLKNKKVNKIIVTRPIVEAGENLGFLPGEVKEKVDPYLIPIYDAMHDLIGKENTEKYLDRGIIEIAPLAYMRGRTLNDAFVILDEAQNTTSTQMKMFLTRLGYNTKMVITGDESQVDLKASIKSGIVIASKILENIEDIACIKFDNKDVVRHPLVSKIINAYEKYQEKE